MTRKALARVLGLLIVAGAAVAGLAVWREVRVNPQTDDAEVFANLIGIAPEVSGRIVKINAADNQLVRKGDVLFEVDPIPYQHAFETARSQQAALEGQIKDLSRAIESEKNAIDAAKATLSQSEADYTYAENNVLRLEPLLTKQFVTVDLVDQARTSRSVKGESVRQARSRLALAQAQWASAVAREKEAQAGFEQSNAQLDQSKNSVVLLDPLQAQREARDAAVRDAAYNLDRCKVLAPFDGRVTNLTISEGAYAHLGQQIFTLIDTRTWWVVANFRETELKQIQPGTTADVYIMSQPGRKFEGVVDSSGFGVTPDASLVGSLSQGLPDVQRSLNWVHLATRFPVRIRIGNPSPDDFRIGASAMVVVRGAAAPSRR
jgi:multidrug efflux system membrane fusion protein